MNNEEIAATLFSSRHMQTGEEVERFEYALEQVSDTDISLLPALYTALDDGTAQPDIMWRVVHLVESFEMQASLNAMLAAMGDQAIYARAYHWLQTLHFRIFNDPSAIAMYRQILTTYEQPQVEEIANHFLQNLSQQEPALRSRIHQILDGE